MAELASFKTYSGRKALARPLKSEQSVPFQPTRISLRIGSRQRVSRLENIPVWGIYQAHRDRKMGRPSYLYPNPQVQEAIGNGVLWSIYQTVAIALTGMVGAVTISAAVDCVRNGESYGRALLRLLD